MDLQKRNNIRFSNQSKFIRASSECNDIKLSKYCRSDFEGNNDLSSSFKDTLGAHEQ